MGVCLVHNFWWTHILHPTMIFLPSENADRPNLETSNPTRKMISFGATDFVSQPPFPHHGASSKKAPTRIELPEATNIRRQPLWKVPGRKLSCSHTAICPAPELHMALMDAGIAGLPWDLCRKDGRPTPSFCPYRKHRSSHLRLRTGHGPRHLGAVQPQQVPRTQLGWRIESCLSIHLWNRSPPLW